MPSPVTRFKFDDLPWFQRLMVRISPIVAIGIFAIGEIYHRADPLEILLIALTCAAISLLQVWWDTRKHPFKTGDKG
jgi:hypothetical protein